MFNPCLIEVLMCFGVYKYCMMLLCRFGVESGLRGDFSGFSHLSFLGFLGFCDSDRDQVEG